MPFPEYSSLHTSPQASESEDVELLTPEDCRWHYDLPAPRTKPRWLSESTAWKTLVVSSVISLAISAANVTFLSAWATTSSRHGGAVVTASSPLEYPSVYIGLERVSPDLSRCLSRETYPDTFSTYNARGGPRAGPNLKYIHAPEDDVALSFGGPIRAIVEAYIPDYGLENCTFIVHSSGTPQLGQGRGVDVYLLPGKDSVSPPFHCPSQSRVRWELRCDEEDCMVQFWLQGLKPIPAASPASIMKTGFRVNQYEAVDCIPGTFRLAGSDSKEAGSH